MVIVVMKPLTPEKSLPCMCWQSYYGKGVAQKLMKAGLQQLTNYPQVCLWVLKENKRAIRFYEKCGFVPNGEELISSNIGATEIRMVLKCEG
jgi:predicted GNAT family N-acyltransferase